MTTSPQTHPVTLSARGAGMAEGGLAPYIAAHIARRTTPGYVSLAIAENHQVFPHLQPRLQDIPPVPLQAVSYGEPAGSTALRSAIADVLGTHVFDRPVDPDTVQVLAGASAVLEALAMSLADPGDVVLVPTPSYAGFWPDLSVRAGVGIVPVPTSPEDGFRLTPQALDAAMSGAGARVRALLLTNPDNPRGQVLPAEDVDAILSWADDAGIHVIADEVYALTVFDGTPMPSAGRLRPSLGDRVHVVWAASKDLGMSGLRVGVLVSENAELRATLELQAIWSGCSGHTQHVLAAMLGDEAWVGDYVEAMRGGLRDTATSVRAALDAVDVPSWAPQAGFFVLCDLRDRLAAPTWEAEHALWSAVLERTDVNLTPGSALRSPEPGLFRLCYAANPPEVVMDAIARVGAALS